MTPDPKAPFMDVRAIMETIPHRFPMLFIDRVVSMDSEAKTLTALKNVTMNEPFFQGHYPGIPIMPGVLQIEAMAQAAAIYMLLQPENRDKVPFFTGIDGVKFRRQVVPGDQLRIEVKMLRVKSRIAKGEGKVYVGEELAAEAVLTCMLGDRES